jgi:uncharacterized membrane protein YcaP (DUF421 family)
VEKQAMPKWLQVDWSQLFIPSVPVAETVIRGSCTYLALFVMLRFFRRQTGSIGAADLLVLLLIADAAQNGMAGEYKSITDGIVLVATIVGWEYFLDWLGFRSPWFEKVIERSPLLLIRDGKILSQHLRSELISEDDLRAHLRLKGVAGPEEVQQCFLEGDGHISVVPYRRAPPPGEVETPH